MRFASRCFALLIATAPPSFAQVREQSQAELFSEGLTACAVMFVERHPSATPPPFPPSSSPFVDNGFGKERAIAHGLKPLPVEDLLRAGWEMPGQLQSMEFAKRGAWGRATLRQSDLTCSVGMFAVRDGQLDADLLLATATSWVAMTYPGASVLGEVETLDERLNGPVRGKPTALRRTQWTSPDGMRVSLSITRADGERDAILVSTLMGYLPSRLQPAIPQPPPL